MPQRILRFRIRQDGLVEECVEGVFGDSCHQITKNLEDALGVVQKAEDTSEAFLSPEVQIDSISLELS